MSKTIKPLRLLFTGVLCIAVLVLPVPKASATAVADYSLQWPITAFC